MVVFIVALGLVFAMSGSLPHFWKAGNPFLPNASAHHCAPVLVQAGALVRIVAFG